MSKKSFIDSVEVKSPCTEDWEKMHGNARVRFCSHCSKSVNNLSEMTRKEAIRFVRASGGNLCIRYIANPVTKRPLFAEQLLQITRRTPSLAAGVMTASMAMSTHVWAQGGAPTDATVIVEKEAVVRQETKNGEVETVRSGTVSGTVKDQADAVIAGIPIELINKSTGEKRTTVTNSEGTYEIQNLAEGEYDLLLVATYGFRERRIVGLRVNDGKETIANGSMDVGGIAMTGVVVISVEYETPLVIAVKNDDIDLVRDLIARGANVNGKDIGKTTPLFIAVENNHIEMVQLLLDFGAKVNVRDESKRTPLMRLDRDPEIVKLLLRYEAKIDLKDREGNTALILAAGESSTEVLKALIDAGADLDAQNKDGETALMKAYSVEIVRVLLEAGARVDLKDNEGDTALDWAFSDEEIREALIKYGATGKVKNTKDEENAIVDSQPLPEN